MWKVKQLRPLHEKDNFLGGAGKGGMSILGCVWWVVEQNFTCMLRKKIV